MRLKMEGYKKRSREISLSCPKNIVDIRDFINQHYESSAEDHKSDLKMVDSIASNYSYCLSFVNNLSYFIKSTAMTFEHIRLNLEKYINVERKNLSKIDSGPVFEYMDGLLNVIWSLDLSLLSIKREKQYTDFRKDKKFQTICETINGELSNFVGIEKLNKKFDNFFTETKYAKSYMSFVYNRKISYNIEGEYINVFDAVIKHTENLHSDLYREMNLLVNSIELGYKIKDCKFDDFAFFVTNVVMYNIVFSVLPELRSIFKKARHIMPEND